MCPVTIIKSRELSLKNNLYYYIKHVAVSAEQLINYLKITLNY